MIQVKAKDNNGNWIAGQLMVYPNGEHYIFNFEENNIIRQQVKPDTVCYYSGFKDKNDVKIYSNDTYITLGGNTEYIVKFKNGCFTGGVLNKNEDEPLAYSLDEDALGGETEMIESIDWIREHLEVVGNIKD